MSPTQETFLHPCSSSFPLSSLIESSLVKQPATFISTSSIIETSPRKIENISTNRDKFKTILTLITSISTCSWSCLLIHCIHINFIAHQVLKNFDLFTDIHKEVVVDYSSFQNTWRGVNLRFGKIFWKRGSGFC